MSSLSEIISAGSKLLIFEVFLIDHNLPKFKRRQPGRLQIASKAVPEGDSSENVSAELVAHEWSPITAPFRVNLNQLAADGDFTIREVRRPWWQSVLLWLMFWRRPLPWRMFWRPKQLPPPKEEPTEMTVREFFLRVKGSLSISEYDLEGIVSRARGYEQAMKNALDNGQTALYERLKAGLEAARGETYLRELGHDKYITEENLVTFIRKAKRGLRLDWLKNFTRVVPEDIVEVKRKCDEHEIFDAYVVLHYDPEDKGHALTKAEEEARKDPILFGLIQGRRRLYYIGDWEDAYCNLTLDEVAQAIGDSMIGDLSRDESLVPP